MLLGRPFFEREGKEIAKPRVATGCPAKNRVGHVLADAELPRGSLELPPLPFTRQQFPGNRIVMRLPALQREAVPG